MLEIIKFDFDIGIVVLFILQNDFNTRSNKREIDKSFWFERLEGFSNFIRPLILGFKTTIDQKRCAQN